MKNYSRILAHNVLMIALLVSSASISFAQTAASIDAATRTEVIEGAIKALNDAYVFPEVAAKMEQAIRHRVAQKEYDSVADAGDFARLLTTHLQEISHDGQ